MVAELPVVVPQQLHQIMLNAAHGDNMHHSHCRTARNVLVQFWWPSIITDVYEHVKMCDACQFSKARTTAEPGSQGQHPELSMPYKRVAIDFIGPIRPTSRRGRIYILSMDCFSRFSYAVPCVRNDAETAARKFVKFCCLRECYSQTKACTSPLSS